MHLIKAMFNITQKDIDEGIPKHFNKCPVGLSITRKLNKQNLYNRILVFEKFIYLDDEKYDLPDNVVHFIDRFDKDLKVYPEEFELWIY